MIRHMIGRDLKTLYRAPAAPPGEAVTRACRRAHRLPAGRRRSGWPSTRGEILGLAGLVGSGRTELARTVFGLDALQGGEIRIKRRGGHARLAARRRSRSGVYLVPEDRKRSGLILEFPVQRQRHACRPRGLCRASG